MPLRGIGVWPAGVERVTTRGLTTAVVAIARATESWVDETTVVEVTVTPAPKEALAPAWKFAPVTLTEIGSAAGSESAEIWEIAATAKLNGAMSREPSSIVSVTRMQA